MTWNSLISINDGTITYEQMNRVEEKVVKPTDEHKVIGKCPGCGAREANRHADGYRCAYCRTLVETSKRSGGYHPGGYAPPVEVQWGWLT